MARVESKSISIHSDKKHVYIRKYAFFFTRRLSSAWTFYHVSLCIYRTHYAMNEWTLSLEQRNLSTNGHKLWPARLVESGCQSSRVLVILSYPSGYAPPFTSLIYLGPQDQSSRWGFPVDPPSNVTARTLRVTGVVGSQTQCRECWSRTRCSTIRSNLVELF